MLGHSSAVIRARCGADMITSYSPSVPIGVSEEQLYGLSDPFLEDGRYICEITVLRFVCSYDSYKYLFDMHRLLKEHTSR